MSAPPSLDPGAFKVTGIRTPGLGDTTFVVHHDGVGLVVDPQRDVARFLSHFEDIELRWVLETHLHNDYVSGAVEVARLTGAELVLPAAAAAAYRHTPAFHQEDLGDSRLTIRPIHTPGHTPEHTSYLVLVEGEPVALFSGGSLLVGSAGRPDLLGAERADTLARLQYRSVNRLAGLADAVELYPTHGEGSFCAAGGAGRESSTIGEEKRSNPVLAYADENAFVAAQMAGLQPYPAYYTHMGPVNLRGGTAMPNLDPPPLDAITVSGWGDDVSIIDARDRRHFAGGHIPGSLGVELRQDFGTWVGWLSEFSRPVVLVMDPDQDLAEAVTQLARVGFDNILGVLLGIEGWLEAGLEVDGYRMVTVSDFVDATRNGVPILDVRSPAEFEANGLDGSHHRYLPDLLDGVPGFDGAGEVGVVCESGYRASIAAGLLERHGIRPLVLVDGGVPDIRADTRGGGA